MMIFLSIARNPISLSIVAHNPNHVFISFSWTFYKQVNCRIYYEMNIYAKSWFIFIIISKLIWCHFINKQWLFHTNVHAQFLVTWKYHVTMYMKYHVTFISSFVDNQFKELHTRNRVCFIVLSRNHRNYIIRMYSGFSNI